MGAPLPEATASTSRDTARLKGRLAGGKKRVREDYHVDQARSAEEDNEDESRAGAIKKKQKVDPFSLPKKKTKGQKTKRDDGEGTESAFSAGRDDAPAAHERDGRNMVAAHKTSPPASRGRIKDTICEFYSHIRKTFAHWKNICGLALIVAGRTPERKYKKRERGADDGSDRPVLYLDGPPPEPAEPSAENGAGARKKRKRRKKKNRKGEQGSDPGEEDRDVVMEDG